MAVPTTVRDDALGLSTDLAQAGAVFNDATRLADGGLWSSPADSSNQPAYLGMYTTDINAVSDDIAAILANPAATTIGGVAYTPSTTDVAALTEIEGQLQTLLANAPQAVGNSHAEVLAQQSVHALRPRCSTKSAAIRLSLLRSITCNMRPAPALTMSGFRRFLPALTIRPAWLPRKHPMRPWPRSARCSMPRTILRSAASITQISPNSAVICRQFQKA